MATTVTSRLWRQSSPDAVDQDLAAIWREVGERGPVARSMMSNLVVFRLNERRAAERPDTRNLPEVPHPPAQPEPADPRDLSDNLLREVVARHPSRTIVVEQDRGRHEPGRPVEARVGVSVFGPASAQYAVEWVVLRSTCGEASWPSVVRRFARGDVPTSIWWTDDFSNADALEAIVSSGRQLLYDSRLWRDVPKAIGVLSKLLDQHRIDLVDLNWRRLAPLRLGLAQAYKAGARLEPSGSARAAGAPAVRIAYRRGELALASLLAGWLAARMNCDAASWPALVESEPGPELLQIELAGTDQRVVARLSEARAQIDQTGTPALTVAVPHEAPAEGIAVELRSLSTDRALREAILALAHRQPEL
jgi:glucose-6-phosphate dehydrogenase assembly protein OpcA